MREQSARAEETRLILPTAINARPLEKASTDQKHLYVAESDGLYPHVANGWEREILDAELADPALLGWYRNPTGGRRALRIPYANESEQAVYPDFIFFHRSADGEVSVSIVDPHGTHLADAVNKLRALAAYAAKHGDIYARVDAVAKGTDGRLLRLNLCRVEQRTAALDVRHTEDIDAAFEKYGSLYA